jgi:hypothetical protein
MPRSRLPVLLAAPLAITALVVAGCGSSSKSSTPTPSTVAPAHVSPTKSASSRSGIPQNNGGDHDSDNNGGPSDGDGNV